ncbi:MAG: hypothetical protein MZW92_52145 [Comamonadaceae bacterium]|nr:hypothetical protein [Comamonadaceae bacterium]
MAGRSSHPRRSIYSLLWPAALPQPSPKSARPLAATLRPVPASPMPSAAPEPAAPRSGDTRQPRSPKHVGSSRHGLPTARRSHARAANRAGHRVASSGAARLMSGSGAYSPTTDDHDTVGVVRGSGLGVTRAVPTPKRCVSFALPSRAPPPGLSPTGRRARLVRHGADSGDGRHGQRRWRGIRLARSSGYALLDAQGGGNHRPRRPRRLRSRSRCGGANS